jgi:hypothetical protein
MVQHYIVRYDEHKDKYCLMEVLEQELKLHSMYNTLVAARSNANKLNEQYQLLTQIGFGNTIAKS